MLRPVVNLDELKLEPTAPEFSPTGAARERYEALHGEIGARIGAKKLGYSLTVVPPGKRAYPFHNHRFNEEMFLILEGEGQLRFGGELIALRTGDIIACPPGGPEVAHQIINTSKHELRYLALSTRTSPEICDYPDTGKFSVFADVSQPGDNHRRIIHFVGKPELGVDYWDGE